MKEFSDFNVNENCSSFYSVCVNDSLLMRYQPDQTREKGNEFSCCVLLSSNNRVVREEYPTCDSFEFPTMIDIGQRLRDIGDECHRKRYGEVRRRIFKKFTENNRIISTRFGRKFGKCLSLFVTEYFDDSIKTSIDTSFVDSPNKHQKKSKSYQILRKLVKFPSYQYEDRNDLYVFVNKLRIFLTGRYDCCDYDCSHESVYQMPNVIEYGAVHVSSGIDYVPHSAVTSFVKQGTKILTRLELSVDVICSFCFDTNHLMVSIPDDAQMIFGDDGVLQTFRVLLSIGLNKTNEGHYDEIHLTYMIKGWTTNSMYLIIADPIQQQEITSETELKWKPVVDYIPPTEKLYHQTQTTTRLSISHKSITLKSITDGSKFLVIFVSQGTTVKKLKEKVAESLSSDGRILLLNKERFLDDTEDVAVVEDLIFYAIVHRFDNNVIVKEDILGGGSYGQVFKCRIIDNSKYFALKRIYLNRIDDNCLKQFHMELLASGSMVSHERLVKYDVIFEKASKTYSTIYLQMQLMDEGSLLSYISKEGPLNENKVIHFSRQILDGLCHLHEHNVIHQDLKCANILLHHNFDVKLCDFGLSKIFSSELGSLNWMAPEIITGGMAQLTTKCDIWSFGATIIEMITGKTPFHNCEDSFIIHCLTKEKRIPFNCAVSDRMDKILKKCVSPHYINRPSSRELLTEDIYRVSY